MNVKTNNVIFELYIKKISILKFFKFNNKKIKFLSYSSGPSLVQKQKYPISIKKIFNKF